MPGYNGGVCPMCLERALEWTMNTDAYECHGCGYEASGMAHCHHIDKLFDTDPEYHAAVHKQIN